MAGFKEGEMNKCYGSGKNFGSSQGRKSAHSELCKDFLTQN